MSKLAVMPLEDYDNACDRIRNITGGVDLIKSGELVNEIDNVYDVGLSIGKQIALQSLTDVSKEGWSNE